MNLKQVKKLLVLSFIFLTILSFSGCLKKSSQKAKKEPFDFEKTETEIQTLVQGQKAGSLEAAQLADQGLLEDSKAKFEVLRQELKKVKELNQTIIDNVEERQKLFYTKRSELIDDMITMYDNTEGCIEIYFQDQTEGETCMQNQVEFNTQVEKKAEELRNYLPSDNPASQ